MVRFGNDVAAAAGPLPSRAHAIRSRICPAVRKAFEDCGSEWHARG